MAERTSRTRGGDAPLPTAKNPDPAASDLDVTGEDVDSWQNAVPFPAAPHIDSIGSSGLLLRTKPQARLSNAWELRTM